GSTGGSGSGPRARAASSGRRWLAATVVLGLAGAAAAGFRMIPDGEDAVAATERAGEPVVVTSRPLPAAAAERRMADGPKESGAEPEAVPVLAQATAGGREQPAPRAEPIPEAPPPRAEPIDEPPVAPRAEPVPAPL